LDIGKGRSIEAPLLTRKAFYSFPVAAGGASKGKEVRVAYPAHANGMLVSNTVGFNDDAQKAIPRWRHLLHVTERSIWFNCHRRPMKPVVIGPLLC
jgi:hypothetical protein